MIKLSRRSFLQVAGALATTPIPMAKAIEILTDRIEERERHARIMLLRFSSLAYDTLSDEILSDLICPTTAESFTLTANVKLGSPLSPAICAKTHADKIDVLLEGLKMPWGTHTLLGMDRVVFKQHYIMQTTEHVDGMVILDRCDRPIITKKFTQPLVMYPNYELSLKYKIYVRN